MNKLKLCLIMLSGAILAISTSAQGLIELNPHNLPICAQQLQGAKNSLALILEYAPADPFSEKFMPTYISAAQANRDLSFYRIDMSQVNFAVKNSCLLEGAVNGYIVPRMAVLVLSKSIASQARFAVRVDIGGLSAGLTKIELARLIQDLKSSQLVGYK